MLTANAAAEPGRAEPIKIASAARSAIRTPGTRHTAVESII
jgi:hypothetical protein